LGLEGAKLLDLYLALLGNAPTVCFIILKVRDLAFALCDSLDAYRVGSYNAGSLYTQCENIVVDSHLPRGPKLIGVWARQAIGHDEIGVAEIATQPLDVALVALSQCDGGSKMEVWCCAVV
jgi:hypothetical protein